jgi:putative two-component system response regulator
MNSKTQLMNEYEQEVGAPFIENLTGLFNHGFFQIALDREIKRSERHGRPFTLSLIDLSGFSHYNQQIGYPAGDRLLKDLAGIIQENIREIDWAARYSGDLFALLFVATEAREALNACRRIQTGAQKRFGDKIELFFGLACFPQNASNRRDLLIQAKEALNQAKIHRGEAIRFFEINPQNMNQTKALILLVDDDSRNLKLLKGIIGSTYTVLTASDGIEALDKVNKLDVDLILLDVMMPGMDGFEVCRRLKNSEKTRLIPIVLITALDDLESRVKGIESGADDFISKPINRIEILARIKSLIKSRAQNSRLTSIENILFSLANAIEAKDQYTQGHTSRVALLAMTLGEKLGLGESEIDALRIGGMLHDIGKIGIPESILNKPGPLDSQEWELMKSHTDLGYKICRPLEKTIGLALDVIRYHHEKLDQSGYPEGLPENRISKVARIMAVVDIFDAMTSNRPYRSALSPSEAFDYLRQEADHQKLDREVVEYFIQLFQGDKVLSEGGPI